MSLFSDITRANTGDLVHQVRGWYSGGPSRTGTNAYFGWMRETKRENTRCGLGPMSDKAAGRKDQRNKRPDLSPRWSLLDCITLGGRPNE